MEKTKWVKNLMKKKQLGRLKHNLEDKLKMDCATELAETNIPMVGFHHEYIKSSTSI
jgi:hypothetical protein